MKESATMLEIRKIRDENSQRHLRMTPEEIATEMNESIERFIKRMGKDIKVVSCDTPQTQSKRAL